MSERDLTKPIGEDINYPLVALVGVVFIILTVATIWAAQGYYYKSVEKEWERKLVAIPNSKLAEYNIDQQELLNSYGWADREKRLATIPIDLAMELAVKQGIEQPAAPTAVVQPGDAQAAEAPTPEAEAAGVGAATDSLDIPASSPVEMPAQEQ